MENGSIRYYWLVGGCERHAKGYRSFAVPYFTESKNKLTILKRNSKNLLSTIQKYVRKESIIMTDKWKGYNHLSKHDFIHMALPH